MKRKMFESGEFGLMTVTAFNENIWFESEEHPEFNGKLTFVSTAEGAEAVDSVFDSIEQHHAVRFFESKIEEYKNA